MALAILADANIQGQVFRLRHDPVESVQFAGESHVEVFAAERRSSVAPRGSVGDMSGEDRAP